MRVLAIDPGEKVGWAHGTIADASTDEGAGTTLELTGQGITPLKPFAAKLIEVADAYDVLVYEDYRISAAKLRQHIGSNVPTLQLIGMIRLAAWHRDVSLVTQRPADKTTALKTAPAWLTANLAGLPKAHDESHDGDALLHLWFYFWKRYV